MHMDVPAELRYSTEHEWVRVEGETATIGITDFAQDSLGDIVYVQLPEVGAAVVSGASVSEIESTKSVSDLYTPVSGTIAAVNDALETRPELVNQDAYGEGWIMKVTLADASELDTLLDDAAYRALTET
jgi:glycine cleavage system H protein